MKTTEKNKSINQAIIFTALLLGASYPASLLIVKLTRILFVYLPQ